MKHIVLALTLFGVSIQTSMAATQQQLDQITNVVERFCLSGKGFSLKADLNGNVSLLRLSPGGQGKVEVDVRNTAGGVGYLNEEIRRLVDDDTRKCMSPHIDKLIDLIKESKKEEKFAALGTMVNFGCEQGNTSSASYEPPPGYKILNAYVEAQDVSNAKDIRPSLNKNDKKVTASIYFHGKDREFFNCPGGGHGRVKLHGTIIPE